MTKCEIEIRLPLPGDRELADCNTNEISAAMNAEIDAFDVWMNTVGAGSLVSMERTLIKTYFAWKLIYEKAGQPTPTL